MKVAYLKKLMIILIVLFVDCSSDDDNNNIDLTEINITLSSGDTYMYDLGIFSSDEGANISSQANHYEISILTRDDTTDEILYTYKPQEGYLGTDSVELTAFRDLEGGIYTNFKVTKITFTIIE